ncbi:MAG TPA: ATP-binding cassette domain-containing protein [Solirubrobacteraceae bacterium]|nr:ATP-binding cassette domain-containing protein [Solirubrobacteraceae bacterium]
MASATVSAMGALLTLRDVWLSFPRGRRHVVRVLAGVSLELEPGEVVAVLAQRAQGKTSLLRVAGGMERPDRGTVLSDGHDVWRMTARRRARLLGARTALVGHVEPDLDAPVLANITLPLLDLHGRREAHDRAARALATVGAGECARRRWSELPDRERALVAIAQAIAREPRLLLVDDLTGTLGLGDTEEITRLLCTLAEERGIAVLMSVGDAGATVWSERVATLAGGELLVPPRLSADDRPNVVDFPAS